MMTATERKNAAVDALDELDEAIIAIHSDWNQLPPGAVGTQGIESVPAAVGYHFTFPWQLASGAWNAVELRQPFGPTYFGGLRGNVAAIVAAICIGGLAIGLAVFSGPRPGGNGGLNGPGLLLFCMVLVFPCLGMAIAFAVQGSVMKNLRAGIRGVRIEIRHDDLGRSGGYRRTRTTAREVSLHRHERIRAVRIAWYQCSIQWWMFHFIACSFLFGVAATILRLAFSVDKS